MIILDLLFCGFGWYRRWRGGEWYQVRIRILQDCIVCWVRDPLPDEVIITKEEWDE